ncbi:polymerase-like protein, kappa [Powellomyces hirtus]|nr:polymerase-like protein, kappa [Powellomyces hirtus]
MQGGQPDTEKDENLEIKSEDEWEEEHDDWDWGAMDVDNAANVPHPALTGGVEAQVPSSTLPTTAEEREGDARESMKSRLLINPNKAGTQFIDKSRVQEIIYEASKGSPFFLAEQRRDAELTAKIKVLESQARKIRKMDLRAERSYVETVMRQVEKENDAAEKRCIVCVDMDAFYASVEERDRPELKEKPMAVGGIGMLCTANYVARSYGIRSAMPGYIALKLCPELIICKLNFDKYTSVANTVREVFAIYDPKFSSVGLDEGFLDITDYLATHPDQGPEGVVAELRAEIFQRTALTASAGIAPNKMLAKVCSDYNKPNGQKYLPHTKEEVRAFVNELAIRKVPGIGKVQERKLQALGVATCKDLRENLVLVYKMFSRIFFNFSVRASLGIGSTQVESDWERKSVGCERTFGALTASGKSPSKLHSKLREISKHLWEDVTQQNVKGKRLTLKLKTTEFRLFTRARTLGRFVASEEDMYRVACKILDAEIAHHPNLTLRLMGLSLSDLYKTEYGEDSDSAGIARFLKRLREADDEGDRSGDPPKGPEDETKGDGDADADVKSCPICSKQFDRSTRPRDMDEHVGRCLDDSNSTTSTPPRPVSLKAAHASPERRTSNGLLRWVNRAAPASTVNGDVSKTAAQSATCPICGIATTLTTINAHIDKCLLTSPPAVD